MNKIIIIFFIILSHSGFCQIDSVAIKKFRNDTNCLNLQYVEEYVKTHKNEKYFGDNGYHVLYNKYLKISQYGWFGNVKLMCGCKIKYNEEGEIVRKEYYIDGKPVFLE